MMVFSSSLFQAPARGSHMKQHEKDEEEMLVIYVYSRLVFRDSICKMAYIELYYRVIS